MAKQFTGIDGALFADGEKVARVTDWSLSANVDTLETTTLGDFAKTYINGIQSFSGSCSLFYYEDDAGKINGGALLGDVLRTSKTPTTPAHTMELKLDGGAAARRLAFSIAIQSVDISAAVGEIVKADVSFVVTGPLTAASFA